MSSLLFSGYQTINVVMLFNEAERIVKSMNWLT